MPDNIGPETTNDASIVANAGLFVLQPMAHLRRRSLDNRTIMLSTVLGHGYLGWRALRRYRNKAEASWLRRIGTCASITGLTSLASAFGSDEA